MMNRDHSAGTFEEMLAGDRKRVNARLDAMLPEPDEPPASLHGAMRYAVLGGGKRIRAALCLGAHRIFGNPNPGAALDAGCAVELLHAYTLIHDDLPSIDDDDTRRGKPSTHVKYGEAIALLAGDALQAFAFEVLSHCECASEAVIGALRMLSRAAGSRYLVGGQAADIEGEGMAVTAERVEYIHSRKTAELIAAALALGGVTAETNDKTRTLLYEIGREVGFAFQITDDLLDIEGSEELVGKGLRKDDKKGKITHPGCFGAVRSREIANKLISKSVERVAALGDGGYLQWIFNLVLDRVS